ncbi:protein of unknown function [Methylacidimicrobium sp. AP8]|nr:protein of unknown function [Methylacidimicrobium sp. AP8]
MAFPPKLRISAAVASASGAFRLTQATAAPMRARRRAIALPMPRLAPVTTATLSLSESVFMQFEIF